MQTVDNFTVACKDISDACISNTIANVKQNKNYV